MFFSSFITLSADLVTPLNRTLFARVRVIFPLLLSTTFISALSEPIGAILTYLFLLPFVNDILLGLLFSLIAGIMLQISLTELLPESISYKYPKLTKLFFLIGIIFMLLKIFI